MGFENDCKHLHPKLRLNNDQLKNLQLKVGDIGAPMAQVVTPMAAGAQAGRPLRLDMPILTGAG